MISPTQFLLQEGIVAYRKDSAFDWLDLEANHSSAYQFQATVTVKNQV